MHVTTPQRAPNSSLAPAIWCQAGPRREKGWRWAHSARAPSPNTPSHERVAARCSPVDRSLSGGDQRPMEPKLTPGRHNMLARTCCSLWALVHPRPQSETTPNGRIGGSRSRLLGAPAGSTQSGNLPDEHPPRARSPIGASARVQFSSGPPVASLSALWAPRVPNMVKSTRGAGNRLGKRGGLCCLLSLVSANQRSQQSQQITVLHGSTNQARF